MVKENNTSTENQYLRNADLVDRALNGQHPDLLCHLLSPGLVNAIYVNITESSKVSPDHT